MNFALFPLLIVALLMAGSDPGLDRAEVLWDGQQEVVAHDGVLIVGEADVSIPAGAQVPGPVYVIGGRVAISGTVDGDVVQLAGVVEVTEGGAVAGTLRHIAGGLELSDGASVGALDRVTVTATENPAGRIVWEVISTLLLAGVAVVLTRRRSQALRTVSGALIGHPIITVTVGTLLALTLISLFVFMAFTLVLIPVVVVGALAGVVTVVFGVVALGQEVGTRLPVTERGLATGLGTVLVVVGLRGVGAVPLVGDLVALAVLTAAFGAVLVTYYGLSPLQPDRFRD